MWTPLGSSYSIYYEVVKQHIATLQQALIALNNELFSLAIKYRGEKSESYIYL